jgi:3-dehydroquinate synthase
MQTVKLYAPGKDNDYNIFVGNGILEQASTLLKIEQYSNIFIITDQNVEQLWLNKLQQALQKSHPYVAIPAGEPEKQIDNIQRIWTAMRDAGCDRKSLVIVLGGGVIGDMGSFAASTYMRGVAFAQIPTTLLSQVDSSIGGKTGFDFGGLKNFIGTFTQPTSVIIDTDTLTTLPKRELIAGFAEMLKHGLIRDAGYFDELAKKPPLAYTADELADVIVTSTQIKAEIVRQDVKESGERKLVNFGHTVGHAIEALSWETDHPLLHGEAVAIGMVIEAGLSQHKGYISHADVERIKAVLEAAGLPIVSPRLPLTQIWAKMRKDKKNESGIVLFTLLKRFGEGVYNQTCDDDFVNQTITRNMEPIRAA